VDPWPLKVRVFYRITYNVVSNWPLNVVTVNSTTNLVFSIIANLLLFAFLFVVYAYILVNVIVTFVYLKGEERKAMEEKNDCSEASL
jgi:phosphatidylserine synthase